MLKVLNSFEYSASDLSANSYAFFLNNPAYAGKYFHYHLLKGSNLSWFIVFHDDEMFEDFKTEFNLN